MASIDPISGVEKFLDLDTLSSSQQSINNLDAMIGSVNNVRSEIGAKKNRLELTSSNLMNSIQNNSASMLTIRDAEYFSPKPWFMGQCGGKQNTSGAVYCTNTVPATRRGMQIIPTSVGTVNWLSNRNGCFYDRQSANAQGLSNPGKQKEKEY